MAKQKKKRNKPYTGTGAASTRPTVTHISAVNRGKAGQWWFDNKRIAKPALIAAGVIAGLAVLIVGVIDLVVR